MSTTLKRMTTMLAMFIIVVFAVFVFNQTVQIIQSARAVHPVFGEGVMWGLVFLYAALLISPVVLWLRLPKRMLPPASIVGPEYTTFLCDFKKRLSRNSRLRG